MKKKIKGKNNLLAKIEAAALVGRGGASFPVALKWFSIFNALKKETEAYIVVNAAEGEPGVKKDGFILEKHTEDFLDGLKLAFEFLDSKKVKKIYLFINKEYFKKSALKIKKLLEQKKYQELANKFDFFLKPIDSGYIGGEETAILNIIEGKKAEPRFRPPFPTTFGLFAKPTMVNNVETFVDVALVSRGEYKNDRFYTISGAVKKPGVYRFPALMPIEAILKANS